MMRQEDDKNMKALSETPRRINGKRDERFEGMISEELGERYRVYRREWVKASAREVVTEFPLYIQIEHTGRCNLSCPTCIHGVPELKKGYIPRDRSLDMGLYEKILAEASSYGCPSIAFHNNDEPLLLQDIGRRMAMAEKAGFIDMIMTTNATLLDDKISGEIMRSGLTKINFSVDAASEEDYRTARPGGDFHKVVANVVSFHAMRESEGRRLPVTRATCVLNSYTMPKKEDFLRFWTGKVDMVEFQNFQALKDYTEHLSPEGAVVDRGFLCNAPWQQVVIRPNGDVLPCCSFYGTGLVLGNVSEDTIYDIWNGEKMKKMRVKLEKGEYSFNGFCRDCSGTFYSTREG